MWETEAYLIPENPFRKHFPTAAWQEGSHIKDIYIVFSLRREQHFLFCGRLDSQNRKYLPDWFWPTKQMEEYLGWKFCWCLHAKPYNTTRTWMAAYVFMSWNIWIWGLNWQTLTILTNTGSCEDRQWLNSQADKCQQYQDVNLHSHILPSLSGSSHIQAAGSTISAGWSRQQTYV